MQQAGMKHRFFFKDDVTSFFGYVCVCVYIYIYTHTYAARGLTFARNPRNSMDCNLLCSLGACFLANWEHTCDISCVSWHFCAYKETVPKSPFEAYLKDILRNLQCFELLTKTSTNHSFLKQHQNNLTLNRP